MRRQRGPAPPHRSDHPASANQGVEIVFLDEVCPAMGPTPAPVLANLADEGSAGRVFASGQWSQLRLDLMEGSPRSSSTRTDGSSCDVAIMILAGRSPGDGCIRSARRPS